MANLALILWFPISIAFFVRLNPASAAALALLGGMLLLPSALTHDFPLLPALDKYRISVLAAAVGYLVLTRGRSRIPKFGFGINVSIGLLLGGSVMSALLNPGGLSFGPLQLPGLSPYDALSLAIATGLDLILPFTLGFLLHRKPKDLKLPLALALVCLCFYSIPMIYELRMSPTLHRLVYGYYSFNMGGERRLGGYRPVVFMPTGLALALFVSSCGIAATMFWRVQPVLWTFLLPMRSGLVTFKLRSGVIALYILTLLILCRSTAAIVYGLVGSATIAMVRSQTAARVAVVLAVLVLAYPSLRSADLFPAENIVNIAGKLSPERAQSLEFRFHHEEKLLTRALLRPWFGWGGWNRNRIFDRESGQDLSVTDGYWVIQLGVRGIVGFAGAFGLLLLPIFATSRNLRRFSDEKDRIILAGAAWVVAINAVDLLPNAMLTPFQVFLAGALSGASSSPPAPRAKRPPENHPTAIDATR